MKPAGLLILETPNSENIVVGTTNFYLDPTHQRPIPPQLLSFLPEYYGFTRTKVLRLQEPPELSEGKTMTLMSVFEGVSPDYSIVAQKDGPEEQLLMFTAFKKDYGLTLNKLASWYDDQANAKAEQANAKAEQAEANLKIVYNSRSWRITRPLRWVEKQRLLWRKSAINFIKGIGLYRVVRPIYFRLTGWMDLLTTTFAASRKATIQSAESIETINERLTPTARRVYHELKSALSQRNNRDH